MADFLDELEGFLGADAVTKIRSNPDMASRMLRADEVRDFYDRGMTGEPPKPIQTQQDPPAARSASGTGELSDVLRQLNGVTERLGKIDDVVANKVNEVVQQRGNELVNNAVSIAMRNSRELSKLDARHRADFGEDLDDGALEAHAKAAADSGRPFRTIGDAYEDLTRERRTNKLIDEKSTEKTREALKARSNQSMPGVSPPSGSPFLRQMRKTPSTTGGEGSAVDKAARALEDRLSERGESVA